MFDILFDEVDRRVDESIKDFENTNKTLSDEQKDTVKDYIYNTIDYYLFGKPSFKEGEEMERDVFTHVFNKIRGEAKGTANDIYGAFSGNLFADVQEGRYHSALCNIGGKEDENGELQNEFRIYWDDGEVGFFSRKGKMNYQDGSGLYVILSNGEKIKANINFGDYDMEEIGPDKPIESDFSAKIIDSEGDLVKGNSINKEFFAEYNAYNMTRETGDELYVYNDFYYKETIEFANRMMEEGANYK